MAWAGALASQTTHTCLGSSKGRQQEAHGFIRAAYPLGRPCTRATGDQQQRGGRRRRQQTQVRALQDGGPNLPDLALPKFMPFTPQNALQQAMMRYRFQREVGSDGQVLLVTALNAAWITSAADLLTESFAVSLGAAPYTNFLRRQVKAYLEQHSRLPPKAVVLMALVLPADMAAAEMEAAVGAAVAAAAEFSSSSSSSSGSSVGEAGVGSSGGSNGISSSSSSEVSSSSGMASPLPSWQQPLADLGDGISMLRTLAKDMKASAKEDEQQQKQENEQQEQQEQPVGPGTGALLAGVVELSFSSSTRSNYVTLNPPEDRPYLCNMAIAEALRGRGYGYLLLQAAEELVSQLGENEVFLHLRVQDLPAAGLYSKSG